MDLKLTCTGEYGGHEPAELVPTLWYDMGVRYECPDCKTYITVRMEAQKP